MNALDWLEAKVKPALCWLRRNKGTDNGGGEDGSDFARQGAGGHLRGARKFKVLHEAFSEVETMPIVS